MNLNIIGEMFSETGYGIHTRNLAKALLEEGVNVAIETMAPANWKMYPFINDKLEAAIEKELIPDAPTLMIAQPHFYALKLCEKAGKFIGFVVFEGSRICKHWEDSLNDPRVDEVFVPSTHTKSALRGVKKPIHIIPHGVDINTFKPVSPLEEKNKFTFLYIGGWVHRDSDRRRLDIALRAFCNAFKEGEAQFILKLNPVYGGNHAEMIRSLNLKGAPRKDIRIIDALVPASKLPGIYAMGDVFVYPTMAEGFGMTALEAMACGVPVIATNYGGQLDFVNNSNGWLIDIEAMTRATSPEWFYERAEWAIPSEKKLSELMRYVFDNQDEVKKKSKAALIDASKWTWKESAKKVIKSLNSSTTN